MEALDRRTHLPKVVLGRVAREVGAEPLQVQPRRDRHRGHLLHVRDPAAQPLPQTRRTLATRGPRRLAPCPTRHSLPVIPYPPASRRARLVSLAQGGRGLSSSTSRIPPADAGPGIGLAPLRGNASRDIGALELGRGRRRSRGGGSLVLEALDVHDECARELNDGVVRPDAVVPAFLAFQPELLAQDVGRPFACGMGRDGT